MLAKGNNIVNGCRLSQQNHLLDQAIELLESEATEGPLMEVNGGYIVDASWWLMVDVQRCSPQGNGPWTVVHQNRKCYSCHVATLIPLSANTKNNQLDQLCRYSLAFTKSARLESVVRRWKPQAGTNNGTPRFGNQSPLDANYRLIAIDYWLHLLQPGAKSTDIGASTMVNNMLNDDML